MVSIDMSGLHELNFTAVNFKAVEANKSKEIFQISHRDAMLQGTQGPLWYCILAMFFFFFYFLKQKEWIYIQLGCFKKIFFKEKKCFFSFYKKNIFQKKKKFLNKNREMQRNNTKRPPKFAIASRNHWIWSEIQYCISMIQTPK